MTATSIPQPEPMTSFHRKLSAGVTTLAAVASEIGEGLPVPALTVDQIDDCIVDIEFYKRELAVAKKAYDDAQDVVIQIVQAHGSVPPHAEQSKRLLGRRNVATITTGTTTTVNEDAVDELKQYLGSTHRSIFESLFATETKRKLIDGARNVLSAIALPKRAHEKVLSLFGRCFDIKPKSPSLKVEVIKAEKPARKPRAEKAAA